MTDETLSDKIFEDMYIGPEEEKEETEKSGELLMIPMNDAKEKIQKCKKKLKEELPEKVILSARKPTLFRGGMRADNAFK